MIQQLRLDGFLSFAPGSEPIDLRPLNVLIGPNGSGKSNLIAGIGLLAAVPGDLAMELSKGGGQKQWVWKGDPPTDVMGIEALIDPSHTAGGHGLRYSLRLSTANRRVEVTEETLEPTVPPAVREATATYRRSDNPDTEIEVGVGTRVNWSEGYYLQPQQSVLSQGRDPVQYPELARLADRFRGIRIFNRWVIGRDSPVRHPQPDDLPDDRLLPDSTNLAVVLNRLLETEGDRINELLRRFLPHSGRLSIRRFAASLEVQLEERDMTTRIPALRISDGTLRFLALLATLLSPAPPPLLCIEEPELGLHPDSVALLGELLVEASERMQLLVTTHSEALVGAMTSQPDDVIVCEGLGPGTVLERLDPDGLSSWLAEYSLGDLWARGVLGGNP